MRTLRTVACVALLVVLAACSGGSDGSARSHRAARPTTTTTVPPPATSTTAPRRFTVTGSRAGFAHGFELVRRESPADVEADLDLMASTGAQWLRASLTWGSIELQPGVYNWTGTDRVVQGALARGMSVVAVISSAPGWDRKPGCRTDECAPNDLAPYAAFARVAAQRYAPLGVHAWEIWNEPNHVAFWGPQPDPVAYTDLLRQSSAAIHAVDPGATVMNGGMAPAPDRNGEISPVTFLRRVYELGGGPSMDAVAHHPYQFPDPPTSPEPSNAFLQTERLHDLMVSFGDGSKKIWGTEVGAPTRGAQSVSEANQATWLRQYYDIWNGWAFTGPLLWYNARDTGSANRLEDSYGLVHHDRTPKPGLGAFEDMVSSSVLEPATTVPRS
ncbi:MAG TPA: cellulase family glycosylhydrolase [Acidimicrobiia bacterium]